MNNNLLKWILLLCAMCCIACVVGVYIISRREQKPVDVGEIELLIHSNNKKVDALKDSIAASLKRELARIDTIERTKIIYTNEKKRIDNLRGDSLSAEFIATKRRIRARYLRDGFRRD